MLTCLDLPQVVGYHLGLGSSSVKMIHDFGYILAFEGVVHNDDDHDIINGVHVQVVEKEVFDEEQRLRKSMLTTYTLIEYSTSSKG